MYWFLIKKELQKKLYEEDDILSEAEKKEIKERIIFSKERDELNTEIKELNQKFSDSDIQYR